ncbi:hypothetical protein NE857_19095 [Nocardiopsis exhalans]|uniref:Uncharacterized protein n=1 Tax=Nocardiopsis exhalans TaxID=163604 RepID=A0ABY5D1N7_9ACTN|nr:hypothetical protein [Nocardiopsis exhalans]USY17448.1 hypothetical protein NE857_19095 [Nocardiopsis exhalans]
MGARIFVHLPKTGYAGVGEVTGEAAPYTETVLEVDGEQRRFTDLDLEGAYTRPGEQEDENLLEHIVPVRWLRTRSREDAVWRLGFFANQNSACRFRNSETLTRLREEFGLED